MFVFFFFSTSLCSETTPLIYTRSVYISLEKNMVSSICIKTNNKCYCLFYHKIAKVTKKNFQENRMIFVRVVLQMGEIRERSLKKEKKRGTDMLQKKNPFCLKPLAS